MQGVSIFEQLQLEEALLRLSEDNWCLINHGSSKAIVLGISAKPENVVDLKRLSLQPVPLIRRFSGGGTVFIDENTLFTTFIFNHSSFPDKFLKWTEQFYKPVFEPLPFALKENDFAIGDNKCGGNAQYFQKNRCLHHTSFLFDYDAANMECLLFPQKTPHYRQGRSHDQFLTRLKDYFLQKSDFLQKLVFQLSNVFSVEEVSRENLAHLLKMPHRRSTFELSLNLP